MSKKTGRFSKLEMNYIGENYEQLSPEEMAEELNRSTESVENYIKKEFLVKASALERVEYDLVNRPVYLELCQQFTEDEMELFKWHWARTISQFKDDVSPTEEMQIVDLVKLDLLMNRCLKADKYAIEQINDLEEEIKVQKQGLLPGESTDEIYRMREQIASLRASTDSSSVKYRDLQAKKASLLKDMRATREQRVQRLEKSDQSFLGWLTYLISNPEKAKGYGIEMEKMRLAIYIERDRLSEWHTYEDGQIDQPFLNNDTVKVDNGSNE